MSRALRRAALVAVLAGMSLMLTGGTVAALVAPPLTIGGITIDGNAAVLTGAIADVDAELQINGSPVRVDESGDFVAKVHLGVTDDVILTLSGNDGEAIVVRVPLGVLQAPGGGQGILDELLGAGIEIDVPDDGFKVFDGQMPVVEGRVLEPDNLASLTVNGMDVLGDLGPGGLFTIATPGSSSSTERVTVIATDRSGVSQTSTFTASRVTSAIRTRAGTSVSAAGAQGIRIAKVMLDKRSLKSAKYLRVVVTVKDRRGYLIRGAALRMLATPAKHVANGTARAGFTNRVGQKQFAYRMTPEALEKGALPKYLTLATRASTPRASATKRVTLRLPIASVR
jgi:hypothetical protein